MNVVGLISGGKDSIYNLVCCFKDGHNITALAHLIPYKSQNETDSFMYQSVGFELIPSISECMEKPLIQHQIKRKPINLEMNYVYDSKDEVEDLYELLLEVKTKFPNINAVSCGAIKSNYQKKRLEHVCERLNLQILAYLWERDQKELLQNMINDGIDAIIVKIAAYGLKKEHIGKSIKEMYTYLEEMCNKYGLNMCGEGGEYETCTLDCSLFKKKIVIDEYEVIQHTYDSICPVFIFKPLKWKIHQK
ncbi:diphthine--ammonia ligase, putative [Plasmodium chabaudi chabaudi]|uniref:Diphthine--ammonia ligase n=1 Tax=Plasmodium chabaudi chabaudi TaxID=31271 RepID=A0A077TRA8_PLACU|nr:diphthine--ammonia ligase, putative [Plasmodium chabaudi chabaudi]SCN63233.1 diphthine--ammonia ligase, putative [Plasmodium chabaudi chabaudi]VTZ71071.1 diphthine--ammonia ligase, putative [Plasmodium chabaudi chabaudi]|eukprot:XP_016654968.1 ATP-binding protein, putative [Plasmodium chabaudi chabaudi]